MQPDSYQLYTLLIDIEITGPFWAREPRKDVGANTYSYFGKDFDVR